MLRRRPEKAPPSAEAGVRKGDVDAAECAQRLLGHPALIVPFRHVASDGKGAVAAAELVRNPLELVERARGQDDAIARLCGVARRRRADPARCPGDEEDRIRQAASFSSSDAVGGACSAIRGSPFAVAAFAGARGPAHARRDASATGGDLGIRSQRSSSSTRAPTIIHCRPPSDARAPVLSRETVVTRYLPSSRDDERSIRLSRRVGISVVRESVSPRRHTLCDGPSLSHYGG